MSDLLLLLKLRFVNFWRINELRYGNDPKLKKQLIWTIAVYAILIVFFGFYAVMIFSSLASLGMVGAITPFAYVVSIAIIFIFSLFRSAGVFYDKGAFNILIPMPISKTAIVAERFLSMYIEDFLFGLGIMGLSFVITAMNTVVTPIYVIVTVIATLLLPLLPLTVSAILGSVVSMIGGRIKHKNAVKTVLSLLLCFGAIALNFYTSGMSEDQLDGIFGNFAKVLNGSFISKFYAQAVEGDVLPFALLLLGEIALFSVMIFAAGKFFISISTAMTESYSGKKFKKTEMKGSSSFVALLKREIKMYFSSSVYVVNTIMGSVICVAGCVAAIVFKGMIDEFFTGVGISPVLLVAVGVYMLTLAPASSSSISLEGKYLYILKTMPVKEKDIYNAKLAVSFIILLPGLLSCCIILPILFAKDVFDVIAFVVIPLVAAIVSVVTGLKIDQKHYNIKWKYEAEVVKRGSTTLLSMLIGLLLTVFTSVLVFFVKPVWISALAVIVVCLVVTLPTYNSVIKFSLSQIE